MMATAALWDFFYSKYYWFLGVVLLVRTCIACTRVQTMSICLNLHNTTLEASGMQLLAMLLCGFFWGSNRNHYYLLLV